jgi:hypothetical protein
MKTSLTRSTQLCVLREPDPATEPPGQRAMRCEREAASVRSMPANVRGTVVPGVSRKFHPRCPPSGDAQPANAAITYRQIDTHWAKGCGMNLAERWFLGEGGERA